MESRGSDDQVRRLGNVPTKKDKFYVYFMFDVRKRTGVHLFKKKKKKVWIGRFKSISNHLHLQSKWTDITSLPISA